MYLSRLILNPRSRQVRSEMADLYQMHRTIMQAFPARLEADERVLFRLDLHPRTGVPTLLVQSQHAPDWSFLSAPGKNYLQPASDLPLEMENPAVKPMEVGFHAGQVLAFRLRANPTVKKDRPDEKQGRRVGLVREADQLAWLQRKIEAAGGRLISANASYDARLQGTLYRQQDKHRLEFAAVQFDGVLEVQDPARLLAAYESGIGSAKGFGFGLLSLAPAR